MPKDSPKKKSKRPRPPNKKAAKSSASAVSEQAVDAKSAQPVNPGPKRDNPAAISPRLDTPLAPYDERGGGDRARPAALKAAPWAMLAVMVIFVFGSLRSVMTAPVADPPAATVHTSPTLSAVYKKYAPKAKFRIKVITPKLNLRAAPAVYSPLLSTIRKGTIVLVMKRKGDWYRAITPAGDKGWVNANPSYSKVVKK